VIGLTLDTAKTVAAAAVIALVGLAIVTALLMKSIAQKIAFALVLGLLAVLVWSQRASLEDCADRVQASLAAGTATDTTCSFLGRDVSVSASGS
jgi:hypothetical protein